MSQSIMSDRISESTIARIAGNLLSGIGPKGSTERDLQHVKWAVHMARAIADEVVRTRPPVKPPEPDHHVWRSGGRGCVCGAKEGTPDPCPGPEILGRDRPSMGSDWGGHGI